MTLPQGVMGVVEKGYFPSLGITYIFMDKTLMYFYLKLSHFIKPLCQSCELAHLAPWRLITTCSVPQLNTSLHWPSVTWTTTVKGVCLIATWLIWGIYVLFISAIYHIIDSGEVTEKVFGWTGEGETHLCVVCGGVTSIRREDNHNQSSVSLCSVQRPSTTISPQTAAAESGMDALWYEHCTP